MNTPVQVKIGGTDANFLNAVYAAMTMMKPGTWESTGWVHIDGRDWSHLDDDDRDDDPSWSEAFDESMRFAQETQKRFPTMACIGIQSSSVDGTWFNAKFGGYGNKNKLWHVVTVLMPDGRSCTVTTSVILGQPVTDESRKQNLARAIATALEHV